MRQHNQDEHGLHYYRDDGPFTRKSRSYSLMRGQLHVCAIKAIKAGHKSPKVVEAHNALIPAMAKLTADELDTLQRFFRWVSEEPRYPQGPS